MNKDKKKSFLDKISPFSLILIMVTLTVIGMFVTPLLSMSYYPESKNQAKSLSIYMRWSDVSAKVIETEVTSKIEGLVSMVKGIDNISSSTSKGYARISISLKKNVNVNVVRFEISSLLKQIAPKLPDGVSYPSLSSSVNNLITAKPQKSILAYQIYADMEFDEMQDYAKENIAKYIGKIKGVYKISISGGSRKYLEVVYNPDELENYGLSKYDLTKAISSFEGRSNIIGDFFIKKDGKSKSSTNTINAEKSAKLIKQKTKNLDNTSLTPQLKESNALKNVDVKERIPVYLSANQNNTDLGSAFVAKIKGKIIYLRDVADIFYKDQEPDSYFRINGNTTAYMSIYAEEDASVLKLSTKVKQEIEDLSHNFKKTFKVKLQSDDSKSIIIERDKLILRTVLCLLILLIFVFLINRSFKYLFIISSTLISSLFISAIFYYLFDVGINLYTMAGIAVSFGILIDTTIVMVDHYGYYRNRSVFISILAALLTTISSIVIIFFMPDYVKEKLMYFAIILIINLTVSLFVALLFVPALIIKLKFTYNEVRKSLTKRRRIIKFNSFYYRFIKFSQKYKAIFIIVIILVFGIPFHLLPSKIGPKANVYNFNRDDSKTEVWYHKLYNSTFGSDFYQSSLKDPFEKYLGGTFRLFTKNMNGTRHEDKDIRKTLTITASMPEGSTAKQLNDVVYKMDCYLKQFKEIEMFETNVGQGGARITVNFKPEYENGSFPYYLNNMVINKSNEYGGVEGWGVYGITERGFSNSLDLDRKSNIIKLTGYNFEMLYGFAEDLLEDISKNKRVSNAEIMGNLDTWGQASSKRKTELYIKYNMEKLALYDLNLTNIYSSLTEKISNSGVTTIDDKNGKSIPVSLKSSIYDDFDIWMLKNSYIKVADKNIRYNMIGKIDKRKIDNKITKENQTYSLSVAFNYIGSWNLSNEFINGKIKEYNSKLPIGFSTGNRSYGWYNDTGEQYWLILLIVVIIFFVCSILFESLIQPFVIIMLIPISFIGLFLTFYLTGIKFGDGGFASMVLLCGIVVNSGIYILTEYNHGKNYGEDRIKKYVRAYNHKIIAVMLTIFSTILGFVPFMIDGSSESFWFPFAVGTCGSLLFSIFAIVVYIPIFLPLKKKTKSNSLKFLYKKCKKLI